MPPAPVELAYEGRDSGRHPGFIEGLDAHRAERAVRVFGGRSSTVALAHAVEPGLGSDHLVSRFEARYANARAVAERWRNRLHGGDKPEPGRLADYLALIGYPVPEEAAPGSVGETIRAIRGRLERGLPLTPGQRERWDHLVEHNRHDCAGMRRVCLRATGELDAADGR